MSTTERRLDAAIAAYYREVEAGRTPDRNKFLAEHADLRTELESFLADKAAFERQAVDPGATLPPRTPVAHAPDSPSGVVRYFGDYELVEEIARGGMGVVYRARQVSLNRIVALKMILTGQLASAADVQRFRTEAEAAANLDHPNILPIYEVGEYEGQQYFSMKLIAGGSLADRMKDFAGRPRDAVGVVAAVARAVHHAHQRGIMHRDLKPANILLDADNTPYVTDFGLAKRVEGDSGLTQTGAIVGTPSYMAPEQARAEKQLTTAVDVYALGAILYEMLTGRPPFVGTTPLDTLLQVIEKDPAPPRTINPRADRDLSLVAVKCLAKDPDKRYPSASALADELDRWVTGAPLTVRPPTTIARIVRWVRRNAAAAIGLAAIGVVWGMSVGVVAALPLDHDADLRMWPSSLAHPIGWAKLVRQEPWAKWAAVCLAGAVSLGFGWLVQWIARPRDRRAALGSAGVAALLATLIAFLFVGPFEAARGRTQLHPTEDDYHQTLLILQSVKMPAIPPADLDYLKEFLPPEKRKLNYPGWGSNILTLRHNAQATNRLHSAFVGVWATMFAALALFSGVGMASAVAADIARKQNSVLRPIVYAELFLPAATVVATLTLALAVFTTGAIWPDSINDDYAFALLGLVEVSLAILAVCAIAAVSTGMSFSRRVVMYVLWTAACALLLWSADAGRVAADTWRHVRL